MSNVAPSLVIDTDPMIESIERRVEKALMVRVKRFTAVLRRRLNDDHYVSEMDRSLALFTEFSSKIPGQKAPAQLELKALLNDRLFLYDTQWFSDPPLRNQVFKDLDQFLQSLETDV